MTRSPDADGRLTLRTEELELALLPELGGAVASYRWRRGGDVVALFRDTPPDADDVLQAACFPLVPYSNRIRDGRFVFRGRTVRLSPNLPPQRHPLHGQGWRGCWTVEAVSAASAELAFRHAAGEWPWDYEARQVFRLDARGVEATLTCRNLSDEPMPCGLGFHPYFDAPDDTVIDAQVSGVWAVDEEVMPTALEAASGRYGLAQRRIARAGLDNGYEGWGGEASILWPGRHAGLRITSAAPRFQVYAPIDQPVLVAEPVSNANDAFSRPEEDWSALGLVALDAGDEASLTARFDPFEP